MLRAEPTKFQKAAQTIKTSWLLFLAHISGIYFLFQIGWRILTARWFDPIRQSTTLTGKLAIAYLLLSLACTPLNAITGWTKIIRARKPLGLYAFWFALIHGLIFTAWDYQLNLPLLFDNLKYQRYVLMGMASFIVLLGLAMSSNVSIRKKMGKLWRYVQRSVYVAALLAVVHIIWLRKIPQQSVREIVILAVLFLLRVPWVKNAIIRFRKSFQRGDTAGESETKP
ncbi:MAG: ferric reductase-like transmembrane domain-containing protein [Anaerolineae bacterium]|nr:ferric reductase-like transmembrane domain-containing protein [Anaerolineae bacterium]